MPNSGLVSVGPQVGFLRTIFASLFFKTLLLEKVDILSISMLFRIPRIGICSGRFPEYCRSAHDILRGGS